MVNNRTLLFLAGLVWSIAGYNVFHIGCQAYHGKFSFLLILLSILIFFIFESMVFGKLVKKHTKRMKGYQNEKQWFWMFFDLKSFAVMAFMICGGIVIRANHLCPEWFIAFFYTGLGFALLIAGITFFCHYTNETFVNRAK